METARKIAVMQRERERQSEVPMTTPTALVVEGNDDDRREMSGWLEGEGYDVMFCPGPGEPDYTCLGGRGLACPLAEAADFVVIDLNLRSDTAMSGTPGWVLLLYYVGLGMPVIAIVSDDASVRPSPDDGVLVLERPLDRESFVSTVRACAPVVKEGGRAGGDDPPR